MTQARVVLSEWTKFRSLRSTMWTLLTAERDPRLREFRHRYSAQRRQSLTGLIARGVADGEFRAGVDPERAAPALLGPIFYQRLMTSEPFDPHRAGDLIDMVLGPVRQC
jgi:TetR/AcrR family transcriptional regulator of autoinduction and epiphytic fitness